VASVAAEGGPCGPVTALFLRLRRGRKRRNKALTSSCSMGNLHH